ncbi:MAG TPA: hypothetical protein VND90_09205 [Terracidiphilus sp.]|nr:hypothetical protein [Terracidiphilus sp.]
MSRREIVVLVSRALAIIQFVSALELLISVPERLPTLLRAASFSSELQSAGLLHDFQIAQYIDMSTMLVRIAVFLVIGIVLWNCGPWVESKLLPVQQRPQQSMEPES